MIGKIQKLVNERTTHVGELWVKCFNLKRVRQHQTCPFHTILVKWLKMFSPERRKINISRSDCNSIMCMCLPRFSSALIHAAANTSVIRYQWIILVMGMYQSGSSVLKCQVSYGNPDYQQWEEKSERNIMICEHSFISPFDQFVWIKCYILDLCSSVSFSEISFF